MSKDKQETAVNDVIIIAEEHGIQARPQLERLHEILVGKEPMNLDENSNEPLLMSGVINTLSDLVLKLKGLEKVEAANIVVDFIVQVLNATNNLNGTMTPTEALAPAIARYNAKEDKSEEPEELTYVERINRAKKFPEELLESFSAMITAVNKRGRVI